MGSTTPLTVVGGYLGAGKTTLVNRLLRDPGGRRIGVIVNDFGAIAVDADLLAGSTRDGDVIGLANGCVCCTVGAGLHEALTSIVERVVDHVVIEVSGVADPAVAAAWGTVPPFEPAGVVVLVAADQIMALRRDRYVGDEVCRQVGGADLLLVTKSDLVPAATRVTVEEWLGEQSDAPRLLVVDGDVAADVVLGVRPSNTPSSTRALVAGDAHDDRYVTWSVSPTGPVSRRALETMLAELDPGVLRLKGSVALDDGTTASVQVVGRNVAIRPAPVGLAPPSPPTLVAIALAGTPSPFAAHFG
jgi:G3E family GTPase